MSRESAVAFAPASVGNVGVGFDILGHSLAGPGDRATVRRIDEPVVRISAIRGTTTDLPMVAERNTAGMALIEMRQALGIRHGFEIELDKGIPLGSGMGGSAASCVAALVAANALLPTPLSPEQLYPFALAGEAVASGSRHGDNVGPMLLGGLVLATQRSPAAYSGTVALALCAGASGGGAGDARGARRTRRPLRPAASSSHKAPIFRWCSPAVTKAIPPSCAPASRTCWWSPGARA